MNFQTMYNEKLTSAEDAVKVVNSGDWVDYGWCTGTPVALDAAMAKRLPELTDVNRIFLGEEEYENFFVTLLSFGFKYGIPEDSDLVFDVRFLPNPYYIPTLKPLTGNDPAVYDYVMAAPQAKEFQRQLFEMVKFLIPNYIAEGKNQIVISIGCTGGKHRSVSMVRALESQMKSLPYTVKMEHRDIERDAK